MEYAITHLHMRSSDHQGSAAWFEKHFGAKILSAREVMLGTKTGRIEVGSPVRLNISSQPARYSDERAMAELNRLGLEHFGLRMEKLAAERDSLEFQSAMYSSQRCAATSMRAYLRDSL